MLAKFLLIAAVASVTGYVRQPLTQHRTRQQRQSSFSLSSFQSEIVGAIMNSPLYGPIVSKARDTMVKTAESVGIDWTDKLKALMAATDWKQVPICL
jgi:hypothetical protein